MLDNSQPHPSPREARGRLPQDPLTVSREKREDRRAGLMTSMEALRVAVALPPLMASTGLLATRTRSSSGREPGRTLASCTGQGELRTRGSWCGWRCWGSMRAKEVADLGDGLGEGRRG